MEIALGDSMVPLVPCRKLMDMPNSLRRQVPTGNGDSEAHVLGVALPRPISTTRSCPLMVSLLHVSYFWKL